MQDDESNTIVNEEVVADEPQPVEEPQVEEAPVEESPIEEEAPAEEPVSEEPKQEAPSRREQLRIQQLLKKYGPPQERPAPSKPQSLDYSEALDAAPEVIQQLEQDRTAYGEQIADGNKKYIDFSNWNMSLKIDAPQVESKYKVLDPKSDEFHPAVADAVNNWYLNMSGYDSNTNTVANPNIGYAEFVEGFMELVQETAGQKNAQSVKNIAKQAAATGLRPDGSSAKRMDLTKNPSEMTMEELYASIGQKYKK